MQHFEWLGLREAGHELAPIDIDVHRIPARRDEPEHEHYDIRFLLQATSDAPIRISDESLDLRWFTHTEVPHLDTDESVIRMNDKWAARFPCTDKSNA